MEEGEEQGEQELGKDGGQGVMFGGHGHFSGVTAETELTKIVQRVETKGK